jgi:hypothetical protein
MMLIDAPQQQFVSDPFWNRAIPTQQEIREIEIEKGTVLDKTRYNSGYTRSCPDTKYWL